MANKEKGFTPQEDSTPVLVNGTGTPYLGIFNGSGKPILCQKHNLPIGTFVKSFEYVYDEDEEDRGEIMIETDNPDLLDHEDLQYYQELLLQWGYIFSDSSFLCGPPRKVIIIGNTVEFTDQGTTINIKVADAGIMYKTVPANYYNNMDGFEDYIKDLLDGDIIGEVSMVDYSNVETSVIPLVAEKVIDNDTVVLTGEHSEGQPSWVMGEGGYPVVYESIRTPNQSIPNQVGVALLQYDAKTRQLINNFPDTYRKIWAEKVEAHTMVVSGIPRNKYQQIKEFAKTIDNGPWSMDFRDGKLAIHNRATNRPVYKVYTYMGGNGELTRFHVDSNFVHSAVEVSKSVEVNPTDKSVNTQVVQGLTNPYVGNIDGYVAWSQGFPYQGSSMDWGLNRGSNNHIGGRHVHPDGTPMSLMERHQEFFYQDVTGTKVTGTTEFQDIAEAKSRIGSNWTIYVTQADIDRWFSSFKSEFDRWITEDNIGESLHKLQEIPNYTIKMRVKLQRQEIPDMVAAGIYMLQSGQATEELVNQLQSGQLDFNQMSYASVQGREGVDQKFSSRGNWNIDGNRYSASQAVSKVQEVIGAAGGVVTYSQEINPTGSPTSPKYLRGVASFEAEIEVPIAGIRILGDPRIQGSVSAMGADIEETITNQMKATGTVVGDPLIESSFNIQIQNVSKKYSGIWYTKKVTHRLTPESGYLCDIEFVQRSVPVSTRVIQSSWVHTDFGKNIHEAAKKSLETESYKKSSEIVQTVNHKDTSLDQSILVLGNDQGFTVLASEDKSRVDKYKDVPKVNKYVASQVNLVELPKE